jgi:hypothetical protein
MTTSKYNSQKTQASESKSDLTFYFMNAQQQKFTVYIYNIQQEKCGALNFRSTNTMNVIKLLPVLC